MTYIRSFHEIGAGDVGLVGGKGANLGEMTRAGLPVPPGFCLTAEAYRDFLAAPPDVASVRMLREGLQDDHTESSAARLEKTLDALEASSAPTTRDVVRGLLDVMVANDPNDVNTKAAQIREFLEAQPVPTAIAAEVMERYRLLGSEMGLDSGAPAAVAVRSSATAEDLPTVSFAGQQDTYLNIVGENKLLQFVRACWASLWTTRAVTYRAKQGFDHDQVALAVVVQAMIPSETSGILFTANPVTGALDEAVINASWGLGEAVVGGLVTPDTFTMAKDGGTVISRIIGGKERMLEHSPGGGCREHAVSPERRQVPCLTDGQLVEMAAVSKRIEDHYGAPMDIEWAWAGGRFYVLQARAITTMKRAAAASTAAAPDAKALFAERAAAARGEYSRAMFVELFPDPLSPSFLSAIASLLKGMLDYTFSTLGFRAPQGPDPDAVGTYYCQPFFHREYISATLAPLKPATRERFTSQVMNPWGHHGHGVSTEFSPAFARMLAGLAWFMVMSPRWMPRIIDKWRAEIAGLDTESWETMPPKEIMARIRRLVDEDIAGLLNADFLLILLVGMTYRLLGSLLKRHFGDRGEEIKTRLVSGVTGNATMTINMRLWDLAQTAKASPAVTAALRAGGDPRASLARVPEAKPFLDELGRLLVDSGHRESRMDILYPPWREDPAPALAFVRGYLDAAESQSPHVQEARLVREREEATASALAALRGDLRGQLLEGPLFRFVLKGAQDRTRERDTMHFELTRMLYPFRRMLLELGRRWTESGLMERPDDVFFLTLDELSQQAASPRDVQDLVGLRRVEYQACRRYTAPVTIADGHEAYAEGAPPASDAADGRHTGVAGSPGRATGPARIILGPEDFGRLQPGDILVAPLTTPIWTPLFALAGGLVTEVGGILSHGAIVAREYGIPAVMSVPGATTTFTDGQMLMVDGIEGTVSAPG